MRNYAVVKASLWSALEYKLRILSAMLSTSLTRVVTKYGDYK